MALLVQIFLFLFYAMMVAVADAQVAGMTEEDACSGKKENDACSVATPQNYAKTGYCVWTGVATEAPDVSVAPNPAQVVCEEQGLTGGAPCSFKDDATGSTVTGVCEQLDTLDFSGLTCNPDGGGENNEERSCDNKGAGDSCVINRPDGTKDNGICKDIGQTALKCEQDPRQGGGPTASPEQPPDSQGDAPTEISQIACLIDQSDYLQGYLSTGENCSFTQNDGVEIQGLCVTKGSGVAICESHDIGGRRGLQRMFLVCKITGGGGAMTTKEGSAATATTTQSLDSADDQGAPSFNNAAGAVAGGVIGGLIALALVVVGGIFLHRRYGKKRLDVDIDTEGGEVYQTL